MTKLDELKKFMSQSVNINDWNKRRDVAAEKYSAELISQLDCSGFIKTLKFE